MRLHRDAGVMREGGAGGRSRGATLSSASSRDDEEVDTGLEADGDGGGSFTLQKSCSLHIFSKNIEGAAALQPAGQGRACDGGSP